MTRTLNDDAGARWTIELMPMEDQIDDGDEQMMLRFVPEAEGDPECEIRVLGPIVEDLSGLGKRDMRLALEAAQNGVGFLFIDRDDRLWWVKGAQDDALADGAALTFVRDPDELHHRGPLPARPDDLSEDELQELLDETLGRVIG
jgi:hypothetical protein